MILQAILTLLHTSSDITLVKVPKEDIFCKRYFYLKYFSFYYSLYFIYIALWLRIYAVFYRNKVVRQHINKCLYYAHNVVLPLLFLILIICVTFYWPDFKFVSQGCSCLLVEVEIDGMSKPIRLILRELFGSLSIVLIVFIKFILFISLIIPLYLHRKRMVERGFNQNKSVRQALKRMIVVVSVCFTSNVFILVLPAAIIDLTKHFYVGNILTDITLVINVIEIILSFADWRQKLFPYNIKQRHYSLANLN